MQKLFFFTACLSIAAGAATYADAQQSFRSGRVDVMLPIFEQVTGNTPRADELYHLVTDLDGDGSNEVMFLDKGTCPEILVCDLVIARHDPDASRWTEIGRSTGTRVSVGAVPEDSFAPVTVFAGFGRSADEVELSWDGDSYTQSVDQYGTRVSFSSELEEYPERVEAILRNSYSGERLALIENMSSEEDRTLFGGADLNHDGEPEYMVLLDYDYLCSDTAGCPLLLFSSLQSGPFARLRSASTEVAVSDDIEEGRLKTIYAADAAGGVDRWSWAPADGRYSRAEK